MRTVCFILLLYAAANCFAQDEATFNVSKNKKVNIECKFDTLVGNSFYYFKVYGATTKDLVPGKFIGGEVWLNDTAVCIHTKSKTSLSTKYRLELFYKKDALSAFSKDFVILTQKEFQPRTVGFSSSGISIDALGIQLTGNDSVSQKKLSTDYPLFAFEWSNTSRQYKVVSFKIILVCDGKTETLSSNSSYFTLEMKKKIASIKAGCVITLKEIKYSSTNSSPDDTFVGPFKIYIRE